MLYIWENKKSNTWFVILEEYERLNAAQLSIDDTEKNKHKKYEATKDRSILLQKLENKNKWEISKNEQESTQDAVLSVIYINLYIFFLSISMYNL